MKYFLNKKENIYNIKNSIITKPIECGGLRTKNIFKKNTKSKPLITIITVVKNDNKNIIRTIKSVINQPYKNIEYIIIDGKSNDGTLEKIKSYENKIDFWVSKKDNNLWDKFISRYIFYDNNAEGGRNKNDTQTITTK